MERTRRRLLAAAGGAGVAAVAAVALTHGDTKPRHHRPATASKGATSRTTDRFGLGDAGIANFLLTVQRVELDLYRRALASGALDRRARGLFERFEEHEARHVARLERAVAEIGTRTVRAPRTDFPLTSSAAFVQFAVTVEGLAASACLGQLAAIDTRPLLEAVLAIHSVDARHASAFALLAGLDPAPDGALAQPADAAGVLAKLRPVLR
jgi:Ferritin-like domain